VTVHDHQRHCCDRSGKIHIGVIRLFHGRAIWQVILTMPSRILGADSARVLR